MSASEPSIGGLWFDGRSPAGRPCQLRWDGSRLQLLLEGELPGPRFERSQLQWPERTRHGRRQIVILGGGVIDLPDAAAWDRWAQQQGLREALAVRWAASWRWTFGSVLLLALTFFAGWRWGIPAAADAAVSLLPVSWEARIGQHALDEVDKRWLAPSELPAVQQQALQQAVTHMVRAAYPAEQQPRYRLHLRKGTSAVGPNAFTLPGGDIVVTDELVYLLAKEDGPVPAAVLGVVAHELGHVQRQHGMRMLFKAGAVALFTGLWIGDYSSVLATVPAWLAQADYSRDAEREADQEALRVMRAAGIDPRVMVRFFAALKKANPQRDEDTIVFGLSSHPADSERVRFFQGK